MNVIHLTILIIMGYGPGVGYSSANAVTVATAEFQSPQACLAAGEMAKRGHPGSMKIEYVCVDKYK